VPLRDWKLRIRDILDAISAALGYTEGMKYEAFVNERKTMDAVLLNLIVIGEAASNVSDEIVSTYFDLPWGKRRISKIDDIPVSARGIFREICRIDGITEIQFGGIDGVRYHGPCKCEVSAHKNPLQIKVICYDKGKYGGRQAFKIRVIDRTLRDVVLNSLREHLRTLDLLNRQEKP
jgi:hypothetical protein